MGGGCGRGLFGVWDVGCWGGVGEDDLNVDALIVSATILRRLVFSLQRYVLLQIDGLKDSG